MHEFKGTPGKWALGMDGEILSDAGYIVMGTDLVHGNENDLELIAAAPELLEACLRIQAQFRQAGIEPKAGSLNPIEDNAAQIDAVILKALGQ